ncbi:MAG: hypothetical protein M3Y45_04795 [Actinomycetota bacterium]|nr:hypothetical protein [Actinomycetota bacterium]
MLVGLFLDTNDINDIRRGMEQLQQWQAALAGTDAQQSVLREVLALDTARLVRLAHQHFGTGRFTLPQLADRAGESVRVLHGMTGSLGRACDSRSVEVFDRHGGQPQILSVRQEVADILAAEATTPATA